MFLWTIKMKRFLLIIYKIIYNEKEIHTTSSAGVRNQTERDDGWGRNSLKYFFQKTDTKMHQEKMREAFPIFSLNGESNKQLCGERGIFQLQHHVFSLFVCWWMINYASIEILLTENLQLAYLLSASLIINN